MIELIYQNGIDAPWQKISGHRTKAEAVAAAVEKYGLGRSAVITLKKYGSCPLVGNHAQIALRNLSA